MLEFFKGWVEDGKHNQSQERAVTGNKDLQYLGRQAGPSIEAALMNDRSKWLIWELLVMARMSVDDGNRHTMAGKGKKAFVRDPWIGERDRHSLVTLETEVTERWVSNGGENRG